MLTFHLPDETFAREGVVFQFDIGERSWVVNFSPGFSRYTALHIVGSTAYVIVDGNGHRFHIDRPREYEILQPGVITDSRLLDDPVMVVLAGVVDLSAYTEEGMVWRTAPLSIDGLKLQACDGRVITGVAERTAEGDSRYFSVHPATGKATAERRYP